MAAVARFDPGYMLAPEPEQRVAVGALLANGQITAQALGCAGKVPSGNKVRHAGVRTTFCEAAGTLFGWVRLGTPLCGLEVRRARAETARSGTAGMRRPEAESRMPATAAPPPSPNRP